MFDAQLWIVIKQRSPHIDSEVSASRSLVPIPDGHQILIVFDK